MGEPSRSDTRSALLEPFSFCGRCTTCDATTSSGAWSPCVSAGGKASRLFSRPRNAAGVIVNAGTRDDEVAQKAIAELAAVLPLGALVTDLDVIDGYRTDRAMMAVRGWPLALVRTTC